MPQVYPSVKSTHLFSATLVEQGSVLDHFHRTGGYRGSYTTTLAMIGIWHLVLRSAP